MLAILHEKQDNKTKGFFILENRRTLNWLANTGAFTEQEPAQGWQFAGCIQHLLGQPTECG